MPQSDAFDRVAQVRQRWLDGKLAAQDIDAADWTVHQWRYLLNGMPEKLSAARLQSLDNAFRLTETSNSAIAHSWLRVRY